MFHILGFIFFIILVVLVIGLAILSKIVRTVLRAGKSMTGNQSAQTGRHYQPQGNDYTSSQKEEERQTYSGASAKKKVFDDNEGEYVEFEEIKD